MHSSNTSKAILRKKYLAERNFFSDDEIQELSQMIFKNFILRFNISENQNIHIFLPIKKFNEINTHFFIDYFWSKKINVFVPKIFNGTLISLKLTPETELLENSWGILEPTSLENESSQFDYIIIPVLYCDHVGNRIGYGKGFYDDFLKTINSDAKKIGVNIFTPNESIIDASDTDVNLDYLVTPTEVLSFSLTSTFTK